MHSKKNRFNFYATHLYSWKLCLIIPSVNSFLTGHKKCYSCLFFKYTIFSFRTSRASKQRLWLCVQIKWKVFPILWPKSTSKQNTLWLIPRNIVASHSKHSSIVFHAYSVIFGEMGKYPIFWGFLNDLAILVSSFLIFLDFVLQYYLTYLEILLELLISTLTH